MQTYPFSCSYLTGAGSLSTGLIFQNSCMLTASIGFSWSVCSCTPVVCSSQECFGEQADRQGVCSGECFLHELLWGIPGKYISNIARMFSGHLIFKNADPGIGEGKQYNAADVAQPNQPGFCTARLQSTTGSEQSVPT